MACRSCDNRAVRTLGRRWYGFFGTLVVLVGAPQLADAESVSRCADRPACNKVLVEGRQLFARGLYEPARAAFQSAYEQSHDTEILVSLGRTLQLLDKYTEALEVYRQYLLAASYQAPARLQVVEWMREVLPAAAEASEDPAPAPASADERPGPAGAVVQPKPCAATARLRDRRLKIAGGVFLGGATVGLVASAVLAGLNGQETGGLCAYRGLRTACILESSPALIISGFVLSGVGLAAGTAMLTLGLRGQKDRRGSACDGP